MMKIRKICSSILLLSIIVTVVAATFMPIYAEAAQKTTFGEMLDDLEQAEKKLKENNTSIGNYKDQVKNDNATITKLENDIERMGKEKEALQQEIAESEEEIARKTEQSKSVIAYLQMSGGENAYLEYVFGTDSITDLVYRLAVVEQITEYNDSVITDLNDLIERNEKAKIELTEKEKESENKIAELHSEISKLNSNIDALNAQGPSLQDEVKAKKEVVEYYKQQGCSKRSDVIGVDCAVTATNAIFSRPIKNGYITSFTGYRHICVRGDCYYSFHRGLDMGSKTGKSTPLYSIGNGVIIQIWKDYYGAQNVTIEYNLRGTYYTAVYAHLSKYGNIHTGMKVTPDTVIGYMGDTGYVTGVHLHLEVYPCRMFGDMNCKDWAAYTKFAEKQFNAGYKGSEQVISFPNKTYQTWTTK